MRELLKQYMFVIYKLTGDCKVDNFMDLGSYNDIQAEEILAIEKEVLELIKLRKLNEKIIPNIIHVPGSLDKTLLISEMLKNGFDYQLRHEGLI